MNKKEIQRDQYVKIAVSAEEKEAFYNYAKYLELAPTKLARNILMMEYEQNLLLKKFGQTLLKAYKNASPLLNKEHYKIFQTHQEQSKKDFQRFELEKKLSRKEIIDLEIKELEEEKKNITD